MKHVHIHSGNKALIPASISMYNTCKACPQSSVVTLVICVSYSATLHFDFSITMWGPCVAWDTLLLLHIKFCPKHLCCKFLQKDLLANHKINVVTTCPITQFTHQMARNYQHTKSLIVIRILKHRRQNPFNLVLSVVDLHLQGKFHMFWWVYTVTVNKCLLAWHCTHVMFVLIALNLFCPDNTCWWSMSKVSVVGNETIYCQLSHT